MNRSAKLLLAFAAAAVVHTASAGCFVTAGRMNFGNYDVADPAGRDTMLSITLSCQEVQSRDLSVSIGPSATSGAIHSRQMRSGAGGDLLNYNLFADPSHTQVWGDGTSADPIVVQGVSRDTPKQLWVYAHIAPGQDVSAGMYSDSITVTVDVLR